MAKYVLLEFDNDNEADEFTKLAEYGEYHIDWPVLKKLKVVGEFQKPTQFCQCTQEQKAGKVGTTGQRFGWFVCGNCKRPTKGGNQRIYNLLENDGRPSWKRELFLNVLSRY